MATDSDLGTSRSGVRRYRGRTLDELLPRIRAELGADAVILREREGLVGGVGGFFAQRFIEVDARRGDGQSIDVYDDAPEDDLRALPAGVGDPPFEFDSPQLVPPDGDDITVHKQASVLPFPSVEDPPPDAPSTTAEPRPFVPPTVERREPPAAERREQPAPSPPTASSPPPAVAPPSAPTARRFETGIFMERLREASATLDDDELVELSGDAPGPAGPGAASAAARSAGAAHVDDEPSAPGDASRDPLQIDPLLSLAADLDGGGQRAAAAPAERRQRPRKAGAARRESRPGKQPGTDRRAGTPDRRARKSPVEPEPRAQSPVAEAADAPAATRDTEAPPSAAGDSPLASPSPPSAGPAAANPYDVVRLRPPRPIEVPRIRRPRSLPPTPVTPRVAPAPVTQRAAPAPPAPVIPRAAPAPPAPGAAPAPPASGARGGSGIGPRKYTAPPPRAEVEHGSRRRQSDHVLREALARLLGRRQSVTLRPPPPQPLDTVAARAVATELSTRGASQSFTDELISAAGAHGNPLTGSLRAAAEAEVARRIVPAPALPATGAALAFIGAGGSGKTRCTAAMASAYRRGSTLTVTVVALDNPDGARELRKLLAEDGVPVLSLSGERARRAIEQGRQGGLVIVDTAAATPTDPHAVEALAAKLEPLGLDGTYVALPATLGSNAARRALASFGPLHPTAVTITHADETDQLAVAVEIAIAHRIPLAYFHAGTDHTNALSAIDPPAIAQELLA